MNWYEVTIYRSKWNIVLTECYQSCDPEGAKQQCWKNMQADDEITAVRQLVSAVDVVGAMLLAQADARKPLREALRQINDEADFGITAVDEYPSSVCRNVYRDIQVIARKALLATPDAPAPDPEAITLGPAPHGRICGRCQSAMLEGRTAYLDSESWMIFCSPQCRESVRRNRESE